MDTGQGVHMMESRAAGTGVGSPTDSAGNGSSQRRASALRGSPTGALRFANSAVPTATARQLEACSLSKREGGYQLGQGAGASSGARHGPQLDLRFGYLR